jgi:hypothetical protein
MENTSSWPTLSTPDLRKQKNVFRNGRLHARFSTQMPIFDCNRAESPQQVFLFPPINFGV